MFNSKSKSLFHPEIQNSEPWLLVLKLVLKLHLKNTSELAESWLKG